MRIDGLVLFVQDKLFRGFKETSVNKMDYIKMIEIFVQFLIGIGSLWIGYSANKIATQQHEQLKYKKTQDEREIFYSNYKKVSEALGNVVREGRVNDIKLFWEARDEARLFLPRDIEAFTEELRKKAVEGFSLRIKLDDKSLSPKERPQKVSDEVELLNYFQRLKPNELYAPYLKIEKGK